MREESNRMHLQEKQKRAGNRFASVFEQFDRQLRTEGYPTDDLRRNGQCLLAPGITVKQYVETLRALEKLEEVDNTVRYRKRRQRISEEELAAIILNGFLNAESARWHRAVAHSIVQRIEADG